MGAARSGLPCTHSFLPAWRALNPIESHATHTHPPSAPPPLLLRKGVARARAKVIMKKGSTDAGAVCHVCGAKGHCAGFIGSVYVDCPNRPVRALRVMPVLVVCVGCVGCVGVGVASGAVAL